MSDYPDFSIIIPTRDRHRRLAACLDSITHLEYPGSHFEVIVIDDGSKTSVASVTSPFRDLLDLTIRTQPNAGPASARNAGASVARGHFLAFTDDDCTPASDWLQKLRARFDAAPSRAIGGRTINALPENPYSTASQLLISYLCEYYNADAGDALFLPSNNFAFPAELFRSIGGFDPAYPSAAAEDRDLCNRWRLCGYGMTYAPEVVVYHSHRLRANTFWQQHFRYGRGALRFQRGRFRDADEKFRLEPLAFYLGLIRYPYSEGKCQRPILLSVMLIVSQMANAGGFFWEGASELISRKQKKKGASQNEM
jgi:GT2 family glycosyltransferase